MPVYEIKVARTNIETTVIIIDAATQDDAECIACDIAPELLPDNWSISESNVEVINTVELECD